MLYSQVTSCLNISFCGLLSCKDYSLAEFDILRSPTPSLRVRQYFCYCNTVEKMEACLIFFPLVYDFSLWMPNFVNVKCQQLGQNMLQRESFNIKYFMICRDSPDVNIQLFLHFLFLHLPENFCCSLCLVLYLSGGDYVYVG